MGWQIVEGGQIMKMYLVIAALLAVVCVAGCGKKAPQTGVVQQTAKWVVDKVTAPGANVQHDRCHIRPPLIWMPSCQGSVTKS